MITHRFTKESESRAKSAFEKGFVHAVSSFTQFANIPVDYKIVHEGVHTVEDDDVKGLCNLKADKSNLLVTTEIIGNVFGKSYLLMTNQEFEILSGGIYGKDASVLTIREEFIKELDNILSASVITKLANELGLKIYGNVPVMVRPFASELASVIFDDFAEDVSGVYVIAIHFKILSYPELKPCFVWVVDQDIFTTIN
ncbi:hypothetical protein [Ohtaekwangia sp.]|uniref:hypothetical protein n=1 Tax=Ohtaekwangia sp. TaxID=2066019 RepID=UPI002FDDC998